MTERTRRLRAAAGRDLRTVVVAAVAAAAVAGPSAYAAAYVANADKVDNRHAVGARASVDARKGKLVATNPRTGQLPANIVGKVGDSDRLDGRDASDLVPRQASASFGDPETEPLLDLTGIAQDVAAVTIAVPGPGLVQVDGVSVVQVGPAPVDGSFVQLSISEDAAAHDPAPAGSSRWDVPAVDAPDLSVQGLHRTTLPTTRTFTVTQAGTYTYYVVASGSGEPGTAAPVPLHETTRVTAQWFPAVPAP